VRGVVDIAINGSYWLGTAFGAAMSILLLDPLLAPVWLGFRLALALGGGLMIGAALVALKLAVAAEGRSLEQIAAPLSMLRSRAHPHSDT